MLGSTTTFYDPALNAAAPEPEVEYNAYLQNYHQPPQYNEYTPLFPPYAAQSFAQPPQYLPTPSVSPISTSGRQIAGVPGHSPTQYYALGGAIGQQAPTFEASSGGLDRRTSQGKRERGGVPQRRKSVKAATKAAAPRKRPRKSPEGTSRASPEAEESDDEDVEERDGDQKPAQRL
jgi:hypothetical protein